MDRRIVEIRGIRLFSEIKNRFVQAGGFDESREGDRYMMEKAFAGKTEEDFSVKAVFSFFEAEAFQGDRLYIRESGKAVSCRYFERIPEETVEGAFFYGMGVFQKESRQDGSPVEMVLRDLLGTAAADAGRVFLRSVLKQDMERRFLGQDFILSASFGPGFYGMPTSETETVFSLLNLSEIGMKLNGSFVMSPEKSCCGLYLILNRKPDEEAEPCVFCKGDTGSCRLCAVFAKAPAQ